MKKFQFKASDLEVRLNIHPMQVNNKITSN